MEEIVNIQITEEQYTVIANGSITVEVIDAPTNISSGKPAHLVKVIEENVIVNVNTVGDGNDGEISHIEMNLLLKPGSNSRFKTFAFTGDKLTSVKVYADSTMAVQLYELTYNYTGESLSNIVVERIADGFTYTKTFAYNGNGDLISINYN